MSSQLSTAITKASEASDDATAASASATAAASSATTAEGWATTGTVAAVAGAIANVNTVATNLANVNNYADQYLGSVASDPTTRTDNSALLAGDMYFNSSVDELRVYSGTQWIAGTAGTLAVQNFSGDGSTVAFTLSTAPSGENNTQVYINGIYQQKDGYGVSGTTLTFSAAPPLATNNIEVVTVSTLALGSTTSNLVAYSQGGTGAVATTVESKLRESVSVKDFGAVGDGVTDDAPAIQAALDAATDGGNIKFPEGAYLCNSKITTTNHVSLIGEGPKSTELIFTSTDGVLIDRSITGGRDDSIIIRDLSFLTKALGTSIGLELISYESPAPKAAKASVYNCSFHGFDTVNIQTNNYEWGTAIKLNPCDKAVFHDLFIYGKERCSIDNYDTGTTGIEIVGSTGVVCYKVDIYRVQTGVRVTGQSEGLNWVDGVIVATDRGLHFDNTANPSNNHSIRGAHFSCEQNCIEIEANTDAAPENIGGYHNISNCFFIQRDSEGSRANNATGDGMANWQAIKATMKNSTIANISMLSNFNPSLQPVTDNNKGILLVAGSANIISNIVGHRVGTTVYSGGGSHNNLINIVTETDSVVAGQYVSVTPDGTDIVVSNIDDSANTNKAGKHVFETAGGVAFRVINGAGTTVNALEVYGSSDAVNQLTIRAKDESGLNPNQDIKVQPLGTGKVSIVNLVATGSLIVSGPTYAEAVNGGGAAGNFHLDTQAANTGVYLNWFGGTGGTHCGSGNGGYGSINASAFNVSSDYRLKENIVVMTGAVNRFKQLNPVNFNFISATHMPYGLATVDGFLAHELAEIIPEAVTGIKDAMKDEEYEVTPAVVDAEGVETTEAVMGTRSVPDYQGIDQSKLVPLLTATIQELIARIEVLENK
jgi:hypothetical protein